MMSFPRRRESFRSKMDKNYFVYILASKPYGILYIGVTNDLVRRIYEHKNKVIEGFSSKYNIFLLVYYEIHGSIEAAITREKQIKKWNREWKLNLINKNNSHWKDLYSDIIK